MLKCAKWTLVRQNPAKKCGIPRLITLLHIALCALVWQDPIIEAMLTSANSFTLSNWPQGNKNPFIIGGSSSMTIKMQKSRFRGFTMMAFTWQDIQGIKAFTLICFWEIVTFWISWSATYLHLAGTSATMAGWFYCLWMKITFLLGRSVELPLDWSPAP